MSFPLPILSWKIGSLEKMQKKKKKHGITMSKVHASSLETVFKSYLAACFKFAFSLSSRGKSLNVITTLSLHPACLSEFPLVAVGIYFTSLIFLGEVLTGVS